MRLVDSHSFGRNYASVAERQVEREREMRVCFEFRQTAGPVFGDGC